MASAADLDDDPPQQPADDVAATDVGRDDAVGDEVRHRPDVVADDLPLEHCSIKRYPCQADTAGVSHLKAFISNDTMRLPATAVCRHGVGSRFCWPLT